MIDLLEGGLIPISEGEKSQIDVTNAAFLKDHLQTVGTRIGFQQNCYVHGNRFPCLRILNVGIGVVNKSESTNKVGDNSILRGNFEYIPKIIWTI